MTKAKRKPCKAILVALSGENAALRAEVARLRAAVPTREEVERAGGHMLDCMQHGDPVTVAKAIDALVALAVLAVVALGVVAWWRK